MVPSVQHLHGEAVALSDPSDQDVVRSRLCPTQWQSRKVGRIGLAGGSIGKANFFKLSHRNNWPASVMYRTEGPCLATIVGKKAKEMEKLVS
jgi:hypothetical protein